LNKYEAKDKRKSNTEGKKKGIQITKQTNKGFRILTGLHQRRNRSHFTRKELGLCDVRDFFNAASIEVM
jgi:hypothetical protein